MAAISARAKKLKVRLEWGRAGESAVFKKTRLKLAERTFGYSRCDIPGRTVADTFLLVQLYDLSVRDMASYSLGYCVKHFEVRQSELRFAPQEEIKAFSEDFGKFENFARERLVDIEKLIGRLLPTYVAQVGNFPMTLQECMSRGSGARSRACLSKSTYRQGRRCRCLPAASILRGLCRKALLRVFLKMFCTTTWRLCTRALCCFLANAPKTTI